jgi:hypothetical protein
MIGLLYALPNTQLTRRLIAEKRLYENSSLLDKNNKDTVDQATSGLNFITRRPRNEIIGDYTYVLENVSGCKSYFDRCLKLGLALSARRKYKPSFRKKLKAARSFLRLVNRLGFKPPTSYYFWRNIIVILVSRPTSIEEVANMMAMYIHFHKQTRYIIELMTGNLRNDATDNSEFENPRVDSSAVPR